LRRIRDALAVALNEADVVRRSARPVTELFLVKSLDTGEMTLSRIEGVLFWHVKQGPRRSPGAA
jgi:hypothetical protein